jgi:hypothetical protein
MPSQKPCSCDAVRSLIKLDEPMSWDDLNNYKYQLDIDGSA